MAVWFVSRHPGAIEWMKKQEQWQVDKWVNHLDASQIAAGDVVIGTLPVHLAEEVCRKGAKFYFLIIPQTFVQRGVELSDEQMMEMGCEIRPYHVQSL